MWPMLQERPSAAWPSICAKLMTSRLTRSNFCPLPRDVEVPFAWDAFQFVDSMVIEPEAGSDDEVLYGRGDEDLGRSRDRAHSRSDRHGDSRHVGPVELHLPGV